MSELPTYVLDRVFHAPRELVWKTWTQSEYLAQWYGPGVETIIHKLDVKPGGLWLNEMRWGDQGHFQRVEYLEVSAPSKLVWLHANSDSEWNVTANPMMPDWPRFLMTIVTFDEEDGKTRLRLTWTPHEASEVGIECFKNAIEGMGKGWGAGMDMLETLLSELQG